jgi:hypothetical protein
MSRWRVLRPIHQVSNLGVRTLSLEASFAAARMTKLPKIVCGNKLWRHNGSSNDAHVRIRLRSAYEMLMRRLADGKQAADYWATDLTSSGWRNFLISAMLDEVKESGFNGPSPRAFEGYTHGADWFDTRRIALDNSGQMRAENEREASKRNYIRVDAREIRNPALFKSRIIAFVCAVQFAAVIAWDSAEAIRGTHDSPNSCMTSEIRSQRFRHETCRQSVKWDVSSLYTDDFRKPAVVRHVKVPSWSYAISSIWQTARRRRHQGRQTMALLCRNGGTYRCHLARYYWWSRHTCLMRFLLPTMPAIACRDRVRHHSQWRI